MCLSSWDWGRVCQAAWCPCAVVTGRRSIHSRRQWAGRYVPSQPQILSLRPVCLPAQVPASVMSEAASEGALSRDAAPEPWFWFRLDEAALPAGAGRYLLRLDMYCDGSAEPVVQTALVVQSACSDGSDGSGAGTGGGQVGSALYWQRGDAAMTLFWMDVQRHACRTAQLAVSALSGMYSRFSGVSFFCCAAFDPGLVVGMAIAGACRGLGEPPAATALGPGHTEAAAAAGTAAGAAAWQSACCQAHGPPPGAVGRPDAGGPPAGCRQRHRRGGRLLWAAPRPELLAAAAACVRGRRRAAARLPRRRWLHGRTGAAHGWHSCRTAGVAGRRRRHPGKRAARRRADHRGECLADRGDTR